MSNYHNELKGKSLDRTFSTASSVDITEASSCTPSEEEAYASVTFKANNFINSRSDLITTCYQLGPLLGEGGYGSVFSCTHTATGEERAVKVIEKNHHRKENNEAVIREYNMLRDLDHPNIIKVYELFQDETNFYIITDLCMGGDVFDVLEQDGCLPEANAALVMNNLISSILYCHQRDLVHRDLKPENILLESPNDLRNIKLIDFGLASYGGDKVSGYMGSTYYISPEVIMSEDSYDGKASDLWSCGVIAYALLSGYAPFDAGTDRETIEQICDGYFKFYEEFDQVSEEAKDFITKLLVHDPSSRPTAEEALQHPWLQKARASLQASTNTSQASATKECLVSLKDSLVGGMGDCKLKQASRAIIASQFLRKEEKDSITSVFQALDSGLKGSLSREDLKAGYAGHCGKIRDYDFDTIFEQVNVSNSGRIEYSEFVAAALTLNETNLTTVFKIFDSENKGFITEGDLKAILSLDDTTGDYISKMILWQIASSDTISFDDFKRALMPPPAVHKRTRRRSSLLKTTRRASIGNIDIGFECNYSEQSYQSYRSESRKEQPRNVAAKSA